MTCTKTVFLGAILSLACSSSSDDGSGATGTSAGARAGAGASAGSSAAGGSSGAGGGGPSFAVWCVGGLLNLQTPLVATDRGGGPGGFGLLPALVGATGETAPNHLKSCD